jgi:FtsZ-interacting cell division protein ZipA
MLRKRKKERKRIKKKKKEKERKRRKKKKEKEERKRKKKKKKKEKEKKKKKKEKEKKERKKKKTFTGALFANVGRAARHQGGIDDEALADLARQLGGDLHRQSGAHRLREREEGCVTMQLECFDPERVIL